MDYYRIVSPSNAAELDAMLRERPLIGAKLRLTLREDLEGDELAARRGDEPKELEADFSAEVITTDDPLQVLGRVAIEEVMSTPRTGRIQRRLSSSSEGSLPHTQDPMAALFDYGDSDSDDMPQFDGDDTLGPDQLELVID
ncbi:MAG: hypothetical protein HXK99_01320 [Candidatus Nanosynbacter sp.]|jgi:hypothetical protein|nr:hypothetical protein [Candidatus Nanosynbacter sp.]MBF1039086.1 hypothetical protein [Candidatus Nanosynbacter sp.]